MPQSCHGAALKESVCPFEMRSHNYIKVVKTSAAVCWLTLCDLGLPAACSRECQSRCSRSTTAGSAGPPLAATAESARPPLPPAGLRIHASDRASSIWRRTMAGLMCDAVSVLTAEMEPTTPRRAACNTARNWGWSPLPSICSNSPGSHVSLDELSAFGVSFPYARPGNYFFGALTDLD